MGRYTMLLKGETDNLVTFQQFVRLNRITLKYYIKNNRLSE